MNLKPIGDRVIAKRKEVITTSAGGLLLPDESQEKSLEAVVVAVGDGHLTDMGEYIPLEVNVGDSILFSKHGGTELKIDGDEYLIFNENELLGIIKKKV